ncbi:23S rRNA (adenine(2503)-C(2))-methyltransferase RlmN [Chitinivibrio alkaliphilus]|uniref:Probable dual-specificity RNA methyltransferase RlmN n=1 Tax=Chitinivibrio alkaliphilus ACht1 TaxID=1313304 RepID=U7DB49_9BACT|nr:23S rRNA (adenine(2503)-C(2))-methyltransferase RlmN [Chitinivibrio alkaliphilus]ERP31640.1 23S rRNA methyltransferase [Chitinivibrio alkaliphilus ACht1]
MNSLYGMTSDELQTCMEKHGFPRYRARQIYGWLYGHGVTSFEKMTNLPARIGEALAQNGYGPHLPAVVSVQSSEYDNSFKILLRGIDSSHTYEAVVLQKEERVTLCISSQIGCSLGCQFCKTGEMGFVRNLIPAEIIGQVVQANRILEDKKITNIVFMGMGEALLNYSSFVQTLALLKDPQGFGISSRRITVSTAGYVPGIQRLLRDAIAVELAVSLNATNDAERNILMPINKTYPLVELLEAAHTYAEFRNRPVTGEYVLLRGVNDSDRAAQMLAELVRPYSVKINLIPLNSDDEMQFRPPTEERILAFSRIVKAAGVPVTIRRSGGRDIDGACGQLAIKE